MRKLPTLSLLSVAVPALLTLPVVTPPVDAPHPVETAVHTVALAGVDHEALAAHGAASAAASLKTRAAMPAAERGTAPSKVPAVLTEELSTEDFQTLGVTWTSASPVDLTVLVRTKSEDDDWSSWLPLEQNYAEDEAAPPGTRQGTDPYFVGPSEGVQVRVDVRSGKLPTDLRVDLVDPGESEADATVGATPAATAAAGVSRPRIYSRADWGADESLRSGSYRYMPTVRAAAVHHTAGQNSYTRSQVPSMIRGDYAYHTRSRGWSDFGYNFVVDKFGRVWEGRAGGVDKPVQAAHASGFNYETVGISVLGNYDTAAAPTAAIDAIARTLAWKLSLHGRDPAGKVRLTSAGGGTSKYSRGREVTLPVIFGHRDTSYTACPGKNIYSEMDTIRAKAAAIVSGSTSEPAPAPKPPAPALVDPKLASADTVTYSSSEPSPVTVRAGVTTADQEWELQVLQPCRTEPVRRYSGTASPSDPISATWDGRISGVPARPGRYTLILHSEGVRPWSTTVDVDGPPTPRAPAAVPLVDNASYVPVTPSRLLDTRSGAVLPPGSRGRLDLQVLGVGGVPTSDVAAVALNVTSVCSAGEGHLTVWPAGQPQPASSSLNVSPGDVRASLVTSGVGGQGKVSIYTETIGNVVVDVVGYWSTDRTADGYAPVAPQRLYDSRKDDRGAFGPNEARIIEVPKLLGIAGRNMSSATLNVTVTSPANAGYLTVSPADDLETGTSSLNFSKNETAANRVITPLSGGRFAIRNVSREAHVVVDIAGFTASTGSNPRGSAFSPVAPVRVLDSRKEGGALTPGAPRTVRVVGGDVPSDARAVVMTLTAVRPTARTNSHLTVWPAGRTRPNTSDLNVAPGDTRANLVVAPVGAGGKVMVAPNTASSDVVLDVLGYYR